MLKLKALLQHHHLTQAALARSLQLSEATLAQIVNHNQWLKQGRHDLKARIQRWLGDQGVTAGDCFELVGHLGRHPGHELNKEDNMLLKKGIATCHQKAFRAVSRPVRRLCGAKCG